MTDKTKADYAAAIKQIAPDLTYSAVFVPQSLSRNAGDKNPSLNWRVTLTVGQVSLTTDYMQGIGHLPGYKHDFRKTIYQDHCERHAVESGCYPDGLKKKLPAPDLADVLHSLLLDAEVLDSPDFETWAADFGYDTDSRKAEAIYKACLSIGVRLRVMLGDDKMTALREALADL